MSRPLRVLLIEDSELDAAHTTLELRRGGYDPSVRRTETRAETVAALEDEWDVIICDYHLPAFSAPEALELVRRAGIDVPFIVVSGAIGEDTAVQLMRDGAHDYLLKDRLSRLSAAVDQQIEQWMERRAKRQAETLFQAVLRASPDAAAIIDRSTGNVIAGSNSFARHFLEGGPFNGERTLTELVEFSQPERITQLVSRGSGTAWHAVYYAKGVGNVANVRCYGVEHEGADYAYVVIEDVTEQHYLKAAFDAVPNVVLVISAAGKLLYANRAAEDLLGTLYFAMDIEPLLERRALGYRWWQQPTRRYEEPRIEVNEQPYEATCVTFRFAGETEASTILTLRNLSDEEELLRLATHDALTGIYNSRYFDAALPRQLELVQAGSPSSLALLDLDHFKPINDDLGHAAGDAALITFTNVVRAELQANDIFARLGGDEFAVVFGEQTLGDAQEALQRIYDRLSRTPLRFDGKTRQLSASCGLTSLVAADSAEKVKERADRALYEAKRSGRGRFVVGS